MFPFQVGVLSNGLINRVDFWHGSFLRPILRCICFHRHRRLFFFLPRERTNSLLPSPILLPMSSSLSLLSLSPRSLRSKGCPYSITERRVPELIPVLGSQRAGGVSHKPGGRLPLVSARPAVTTATLNQLCCLVNREWM